MIWEIDPTQSQVSFAIRVMSVITTRGSFKRLRGQLHIDEQNPVRSWVEAEVDSASINTHIALRDAHLRSDSFFAVKKYPTITFRSTHVEQIGGSAYKVTGNLTLLGITKPITFEVEYRGQHAGSDTHAALTARATINRHDFGLGRHMRMQAAAGKTATIEIALVAVQKSAQVPGGHPRRSEELTNNQTPSLVTVARPDYRQSHKHPSASFGQSHQHS